MTHPRLTCFGYFQRPHPHLASLLIALSSARGGGAEACAEGTGVLAIGHFGAFALSVKTQVSVSLSSLRPGETLKTNFSAHCRARCRFPGFARLRPRPDRLLYICFRARNFEISRTPRVSCECWYPSVPFARTAHFRERPRSTARARPPRCTDLYGCVYTRQDRRETHSETRGSALTKAHSAHTALRSTKRLREVYRTFPA